MKKLFIPYLKDKRIIVLISGFSLVIVLLLCCWCITLTPTSLDEDILGEQTQSPTVSSTPISEPSNTLVPTQPSKTKYKVVSITDGDTVRISIDGVEEKVRLVGIDSPESKDPNEPKGCYADEATVKLKELILNKEVYIRYDGEQGSRDRYDRLLLYIWLPDDDGDIFINNYLVQEGYAFAYRKIDSDYLDQFIESENSAKVNKKGLWGDACACTKNEEVSRVCTDCNEAEVTYKNWDCTTSKSISQDTNCANLCTSPQTEPTIQIWNCDCSKTCSEMSTCDEAQYQLNTCGCSARDGDNDGIACDTMCQ